eukprot:gene26758-35441_t
MSKHLQVSKSNHTMLMLILTSLVVLGQYYPTVAVYNIFEAGVYTSARTEAKIEIFPQSNQNKTNVISILEFGTKQNKIIDHIMIDKNPTLCFTHYWPRYLERGVSSYICAGSGKLHEYNMDKKFIADFHHRAPSLQIHAAIISGQPSAFEKSMVKLRGFFGNHSSHIKLSVWGGVYSSQCPRSMPYVDAFHTSKKMVGISMAHLRVLRDFHHRMKLSMDQNVLMIFENDAICGVPNCGERALNEVMSSKVDFLQMSWCFGDNKDSTGATTLCAQAYTVTVKGANILTERINECGDEGYDMQISRAKMEKSLSFALAVLSEEEKKSQQGSWTKGIFVQAP